MSASALADSEGRKLFLGGLGSDANEDDLRSDFGKFGELEDVQMPYADGKHKGFAFITFKDAGDCSAAAKEHHQREYHGREISARVVVPRSDPSHPKGNNEAKPGDWPCPNCGANVFASKMNCFKCGEPKPPGAGRGGYGRGGYDRGGDRGYDRRGGGDRYDDRRGGGDRYGDRYDDRRGGDRYDDRRDYDRRDRDYDRRDRDYDRRRDDRYDDRGRSYSSGR